MYDPCSRKGLLPHWTHFSLAIALCVLLTGCRTAESYLSRGKTLYSEGKYDDAALNFRKALQKNPESGEAAYQLGMAQLKQNNAAEAYATLSAAARLMPRDQRVHVQLADLMLGAYLVDGAKSASLYERLQEVARTLETINPGSADALRVRGQLALANGRHADAISLFRRADQVKPVQPEVIAPLVKALAQSGDPGEAERLGLSLIAAKPEYQPIYDILYLIYVSAGRTADAENILVRKRQNNPREAEPVLQLANYYFSRSEPDRSRQVLNSLLNPSTFADGHLQAARFLTERKQYAEALEILHAAEAKASTPKAKADCRRAQAAIHLAQGNREDAIRIFNDLVATDASDDEIRSRRALLYIETGRSDLVATAMKDLRSLALKYPNDPQHHANLATASLRTGDMDGAQREFTQAIRLKPDDLLSRLQMADLYLRRQRFGEALSMADGVLAEAPDHAGAKLIHGICLMRMGNLAAARVELTRLVQANPNLREARLQLGFLNIAEKKYKEADDIFRALYHAGPRDARPLEGMVGVQLARQQAPAALELLTAHLRTEPDSVAARRLLAIIYLQSGKADDAIHHLRLVTDKHPELVEGHIRLGQALEIKGDTAGAVASYKKARDLAPGDAGPVAAIAVTLQTAGQLRDAITYHREAVKLRPDDAAMLNNLAYALAQTGTDLDEALQLALKALQKAPDRSLYRDTLGYVYLKKGMTQSALQVFSGLVRKEPQNPTYQYHYGHALLQASDRTAAFSALRQALANNPSKSEESEIRALMRQM